MWHVAEYDPTAFAMLTSSANRFDVGGLLQLLDDCGPKMTFAHANVYDKKRLSVGKANGRILNTVVLNYRRVRSSRRFSWYEAMA